MGYQNERAAQRESFERVPETCPHVDEALQIAGDAIKEWTTKLREKWIASLAEMMDARDEADEAADKLEQAEARIRDLENEVDWLKRQVDSLETELSSVKMATYA